MGGGGVAYQNRGDVPPGVGVGGLDVPYARFPVPRLLWALLFLAQAIPGGRPDAAAHEHRVAHPPKIRSLTRTSAAPTTSSSAAGSSLQRVTVMTSPYLTVLTGSWICRRCAGGSREDVPLGAWEGGGARTHSRLLRKSVQDLKTHTHTRQRAPKPLNPCRRTEHWAAQ